MDKLNKNAFLMLAIPLLLLMAGIYAYSVPYNNETVLQPTIEYVAPQSEQPLAIDDLAGSSPTTFFDTRKPLRSPSMRPQQSTSAHTYHGRNGNLEGHFAPFFWSPLKKNSRGLPASQEVCAPKEYYVFTLKRILC